MKPNWSDLENRGFLVIPHFLTDDEISLVWEDYHSQTESSRRDGLRDLEYAPQSLINYFDAKLQEVAGAVREATGIETDVTVSGLYFAIERGINFPWHQDDGSYFLFQNHYHFLNFYIPILKPEATQSNLSVIPFDALEQTSPEFCARLRGGGATSFFSNGTETTVSDYENDVEYAMPFDINKLAVTPNLTPGDLLLFRGDMIHQTQDTATLRVAISFRRLSTKSMVHCSKFKATSKLKRDFMARTKPIHDRIFERFSIQDKMELSVGELLPHIQHFLVPDRLRRSRSVSVGAEVE